MSESGFDAALWMELARARADRGDAQGAVAALHAIPLDAHTAATQHLRGVVLLQSGNPQNAEAAFLAASRLAGTPAEQARALANAGAAALEANLLEVAEAHLQAAEQLQEQHQLQVDAGLSLNHARVAVLQHDLPAALSRFAQARSAADPQLVALASLFEADLRQEHRLAGAVDLYRAALSGPLPSPHAARAWTALAQDADARGDTASAIASLRSALHHTPDPGARIGLLVALGGHLYRSRDVAGAHKVLDEAQHLASSFDLTDQLRARLHANRGLVLLALGHLEAARECLETARDAYAAVSDTRAHALQLRALVDLHRYRGDLPQAIEMQARLAELEPTFSEPLPEGGMLYSAVEDRSLSVSVGALRKAGPAPGSGPVLFIVPPAWGASGPLFPRGAVSVASFLRDRGIPAEVLPLADVVDSHDNAETAGRAIEAAIARALTAFRPRAVGVSVTFSYLYPQGRQVAEVVSRLAPELPIVIGGPHVTYLDRETLEEAPEFDVVVRGEGEWTALELFTALSNGTDLSKVQGITWRAEDGTIHRNKGRKLGDVRELPPVDFGLLPSTFAHRMDVSALTSRGCAFRCKFCHEFRYWGGVVRDFPVSRIIGEMDRLARYSNHLQGIDDSMLDMTTPLFMELVDALGRSPHVTPNFGLLTRLDTVTREGAEAMKAAGLRWVSMGAESGSQVVLDAMNKGLDVGQSARSLRIVREAGLEAATFFIVGHPGDNEVESAVTLDYVDRLWRDGLVSWIDVSTFSPYPGTPFYSMAPRYGVRILTRDWSRWRRTNRPVAELDSYPAAAIYGTYLQMLAVQSQYRDAEGLLPPGPQATGQ